MITCPICNSDKIVRNGKVNHGLQRYLCDSCGYNFTQDYVPKTSPKEKEKVISAYLKNEKVKDIENKRKVTRTSICSWINLLRKNIAEIATIKKDPRWQSFERPKLDFLENQIKNKGWKNPLSKKQLTELHHKNMEALLLLLQYRPQKQRKKSQRKCYKSLNDTQKSFLKTIHEVRMSSEYISLHKIKLQERFSSEPDDD